MATLKSLLSTKAVITAGGSAETNLEFGRFWAHSPQNHSEFSGGGARFFGCQVTSDAQRVFEVEVEIWGAGGRGNGCSCCCTAGVGGNPGAYMKFKTPMTRSGSICTTGMRACQSGAHCMCAGQGSSSCVRVCPGSVSACTYACTCICVQAGLGGRNMCIDGGTSIMCCLGSNGACITPGYDLDGNVVSAGCGIVCNVGNANNWPTEANLPFACYNIADSTLSSVTCHNSDITRVARTFYGHCNVCCWPCHRQIIHTAPYRYSTCGGEMQINHGFNDGTSHGGSPFSAMDAAVHGMSRSPTAGQRSTFCWTGVKQCTCYEWTGCTPFWPIAQPAPMDFACPGVRTHGYTGGHGAIRIKFLGNIDVYTD